MRRWFDRVRLRVQALVGAQQMDTALRREIELHLDEQVRELVATGMSPAEARAAALRAFGPVARIEEECRDMRRVSVLHNALQDLRYAVRSLRHQPLLVAAATTSIAVAVGANTAIFTIATELLLSTPTVTKSAELVHVRTGNGSHVSYAQWKDLDRSAVLAGVAGYQIETEVNWRSSDRSITIVPLVVTANFFDVLGVPVARGRGFTAVDAEAERRPQIAVVSHGFWQKRLGADPHAVGTTVTLNGRPYTVLGILPAKLRAFPGYAIAPEVYLPLSRDLLPDLDQRTAAAVQLVGRLHPGQTTAQARAALSTVVDRLDVSNPEGRLGGIAQVTAVGGTLSDLTQSTQLGAFFGLLLVVVGLVLGIACANVAGLLLARSTVRRREIAVRIALGASRARLIQQLVTEGFVLAVLGTVCGIGLMSVLIRALTALPLPLPLPIELHLSLDVRFFVYVAVLLTATTLLSSLVPAWQATRSSLVPALKQEEIRFPHRRWTMRAVLVTGQMTVAVVLLVTALLFVRNLTRARAADTGFDISRTIVAQIGFVEGRHTPQSRAVFLDEAVARVRTLPGIERAAYAAGVPLTMRSGMTTGATLTTDDSREPFEARYEVNFVGPEYFATMGIRLAKGREFGAGHRSGSPPVAIVNEEFARRYFSGRDPLGRHLMLPGAGGTYPAEVIGVVGNSKHRTIGEEQQAAVYEPFLQRGNRGRFVHLLIRTTDDGAATVRDVQHVLSSMDPSAAVDVQTMRSTLAFAFMPSQVGAALLGALGVLGMALAMAGLYATVAYAVSRRTGEIGIRMALGATRREVLRLVLADAALLTGIGIALGLIVATFVTRPLAMFLVAGLSASDPVTFAGTAVLLSLVSLAAAWIPARRATRIDPAAALRAE